MGIRTQYYLPVLALDLSGKLKAALPAPHPAGERAVINFNNNPFFSSRRYNPFNIKGILGISRMRNYINQRVSQRFQQNRGVFLFPLILIAATGMKSYHNNFQPP